MEQRNALQYIAAPQWNSKLVSDLSFIKKNLRYPYGNVIIVSLILLMAGGTLVGYRLLTSQVDNYPAVAFVLAFAAALILIPALQYMMALRFRTVAAYGVDDNITLLSGFLAVQHLAVFRHPEADAIFQIHSTPVRFRNSYSQEIMTFIADEGRILINTYYSDFRFGHSRSAQDMERKLGEWIRVSKATNTFAIMQQG